MAQSKYELLLRPDVNPEIVAGKRITNVLDIRSLVNLIFCAKLDSVLVPFFRKLIKG